MRILRLRTTMVRMCVMLVFVTVAGAQNELRHDGPDLHSFARDAACGPKCLKALSRLTKVGEEKFDVKNIYGLIGIPVNAPTNLKHLRDAAQKMGYKVQPRRLTITELSKLDAYAILPVGQTSGTKENPLHFVLFAGAEGDQAKLVDTRSLSVSSIPLQYLSEEWKGLALVIPSDTTGKRIFKPMDETKAKSEQVINFGEVDVGSTLDKRIVVWAKVDKSKWKIAQKSCSCLDVKLTRNKSGHVVIDSQIDVKLAGLQVAQIVVVSEDLNIRKDFRLIVYGKNSHRLSPTVGFIEVTKGRVQYPVVLDYYVGMADDEISFSGFKTDINHLECEEVTKERIDEERLHYVRFRITLTYSVQDVSKEKTESGSVLFTLTTPGGKREIPLKMIVQAGESSMRLAPAKLFILASKSRFEQKEIGVKISSSMDNPVQKLDFEMNEPLPLQIAPQEITKNEYLLRITLIPDKIKEMSVGMLKGDITITLNGKRAVDKTILPVSIFIRG